MVTFYSSSLVRQGDSLGTHTLESRWQSFSLCSSECVYVCGVCIRSPLPELPDQHRVSKVVFQRVSCRITESLRQLWCRGKSRCVRRWSALGSCETFGVGFNQDEEKAQGLWTREVKYPLHDFEKIKSYWLDVRVQRKMVNSIWSWSRAFLEAYIATKQTEGEGECFEEAWEIWGNSVLSTSPILTSLIIIRTLPGTRCYSNFMSF